MKISDLEFKSEYFISFWDRFQVGRKYQWLDTNDTDTYLWTHAHIHLLFWYLNTNNQTFNLKYVYMYWAYTNILRW